DRRRRRRCRRRSSRPVSIAMTRRKHSARVKQRSAGKKPTLSDSAAQRASADERWFREVADYTYDWESWHGPDGRLSWVNRAVERMTGYTIADCLAMPDYPIPMVIEADRRRVADSLLAATHR